MTEVDEVLCREAIKTYEKCLEDDEISEFEKLFFTMSKDWLEDKKKEKEGDK